MNNKVTLNKIIKTLSERSGKSPQMCEDILKGLFKHIASSLEEGETIKIKGFGTFKLSRVESRKSVDVTNGQENEIPAHDRIVFVPSKELASAVNAPFEMFETIELDEEILEEELAKAEVAGESLLVQEYGSQLIIDEEKEDELLKEHPDLKKVIEADSKEESEEPTVEAQEEKEEPTADELPEDKEPAKDEELVKEEASAEVESPAEEASSAEEEVPAEVEVAAEEDSPAEKEKSPAEKEKTPDEEEIIADEDESEKEDYNEPSDYSQNDKGSFRHGFLWGVLGALLVFILGLFALWMLNDDFAEWGKSMFSRSGSNVEVGPADTVRVEDPSDSAIDNEEGEILMQENDLSEAEAGVPDIVEDASAENAVPTAPSDKAEKAAQSNKSTAGPVYDTITTTHYLTTMAKRHYGNYHLWPYIYKENSRILGHPNRIRPGTKVVIPDLKKYGVDPNNPKDIEKARRLGTEIYKKYE